MNGIQRESKEIISLSDHRRNVLYFQETTSLVRIISMVAYLMVMMLQVFLYCYQGNQLVMDVCIIYV